MRISDMTLTDQLGGNLDSEQATINQLDGELSSGLAIEQPSDNPIAASDDLGYQRQIAQLASNTSSASTAQAWQGIAGSTIGQAINSLQSVNTLVLQGLNSGANNAQSYNEMAQQVQGVLTQMVGFGNTTYGDTSIFAGTAGVSQPYSANGTYSGNSQTFTIDVGSGSPVAASVPGDQVFGGGASGVQSVFTTLQNIVTDLQAGPGAASYAGLKTDLGDLQANISLAESGATTLGEAAQQVSAATTSATATSQQLQSLLSTTQSTDIPSVTVALQTDMTNYQAALYAVSQAVPQSLAEFLH
jgi:flagellar hook-associated protein 3 FlgL